MLPGMSATVCHPGHSKCRSSSLCSRARALVVARKHATKGSCSECTLSTQSYCDSNKWILHSLLVHSSRQHTKHQDNKNGDGPSCLSTVTAVHCARPNKQVIQCRHQAVVSSESHPSCVSALLCCRKPVFR